MIAVDYSYFKNHMNSVFARCHDDTETVIVARKNNQNVVIMTEDAYNNLLENLYVRSSKANYDHLLHSIAQAETSLLHRKSDV